jgi:fructokinase
LYTEKHKSNSRNQIVTFIMEIKNKKILCIGEVLWDNLPSGKKPGGAPMNVALHLHNLGQEAIIASKVGRDEEGKELLDFLKKSGMNTEFVETDENFPTSQVLVHLDEKKNATFEICEAVAWDNLKLTGKLVEEAKSSGLIIFGSLASRNPVSAETILNLLENNALKLMDVNLRKPFDGREIVDRLLLKSHIVKLNEDELVTIAGWNGMNEPDQKSLVKWFSGNYCSSMICVTRGEKGALLYCQGMFFEHPGYKVEAIDTVGAGDAFLAGLVAALSEGKSYPDALAFACATGALVASKAGATPLYNLEDINRIMEFRISPA